jgi:hypothetical protein
LTSFVIEHFRPLTSRRDERSLRFFRELAAVWCASVAAPAPGLLGTREAWQFLRSCTTGVDAYVTRWGSGLAAVMPAADVVAVRADPDRAFGWRRALADVIRGDRDETVGGTRHPRPAVAAR